MGSSMVGVALWVGVAGSIQGGFVDESTHEVNEHSLSTLRLLFRRLRRGRRDSSWRISLSFGEAFPLVAVCQARRVSRDEG